MREDAVLKNEGLLNWSIIDADDGYCWRTTKTLQRIPGNFALFLHEVAHALCKHVEGDQHHGVWAGHYTRLVDKYMMVKELTNE